MIPRSFFYSTTASPVVPHLDARGCYPATKEGALVLTFPQILLISKPALECVDNSSGCKSSECRLFSTMQVTAEITERTWLNSNFLQLTHLIHYLVLTLSHRYTNSERFHPYML